MTSVQHVLVSWLGRMGLPVYVTGWVPPDAPRPYLTLHLQLAGEGRTGRAVVRCHVDRQGQSSALRAELMDRLEALVPAWGVRLSSGAGLVVLRPAERGFQRLTAEGETLGGETAWSVTRYGL